MSKDRDPTPRTPGGLRDLLFDTLDEVREDNISKVKARTICELSARIIDTGRFELQMIDAAGKALALKDRLTELEQEEVVRALIESGDVEEHGD